MTIDTQWALDDLMKNGLSEKEWLEYQRLKNIEKLAKALWKEVPEDVKGNLKKYENKLFSNWAKWASAGLDLIVWEVNNKKETIGENFKEEKNGPNDKELDKLWWKFPVYYNPDGSIGKRIWDFVVNNADLVPFMEKVQMKFERNNNLFHLNLISMGVKAYHCNDGWVNRERHRITFIYEWCKTPWFYWYDEDKPLEVWDIILLWDIGHGGRFAIITEKIDLCNDSGTFGYELLDGTIDGSDWEYRDEYSEIVEQRKWEEKRKKRREKLRQLTKKLFRK